jgi:hypothetical protein
LCAEIRSLLKTGDDIPEFVKVVPVPAEIKDRAEVEEIFSEILPYADNTPLLSETAPPFMEPPVDPAKLDWHYVECKGHGPNDKSLCGWFPTKFLAHRHVFFWPKHLQEHMVVKPVSIVDPGMAVFVPEQVGSDVLRETNEFLATCGIAKVGLGELYFPDKAVFGKPQSKDMMPPPDQRWLSRQGWIFVAGDHVRKKSGAWWEGKVVGFYSTHDTPRGYAVQLQTRNDNGPVQIYPESALELNP